MTGARREALWLCSYPLRSHWRGGHTPAGGCHGAGGPTRAVDSGLPQRKCGPGAARSLGHCSNPNPAQHTCTKTGTRGILHMPDPLHDPHTEKGLHTHPAPAGSLTHTLLSTSTGYCTSLRKGIIHVKLT